MSNLIHSLYNKIKIISIFYIIFVLQPAFSKVQTIKPDANQEIDQLLEISNQFFRDNRDSAVYYSKKAIILTRAQNQPELLGDALYNLAFFYYRQTEMDSARIYLNKTLKIRRSIKDSAGIGRALNLRGNVCWLLDQQIQAKDSFEEALRINSSLGDYSEVGKSYNNLGNFYSRLGQYDRAITFFLKARKSYQKAAYLEGKAWLNFSMTLLYKRLEEYKNALATIKKSLTQYKKLAEIRKDSTGVMICYNQLGDIYRILGNPEKGLKYNLRALRMRQRTNSKSAIADGMTAVAQCYYELKKYDRAENYMLKALELRQKDDIIAGAETNFKYLGYIAQTRGKTKQALDYLDQGLQIARQRKQKISQSDILHKMSEIYARQSSYKKALALYEKHIAIQDTLYNMEVSKKLASYQLQHKLDEQNIKTERLEKENKIHQLKLARATIMRYFLLTGAIVFLFLIIFTIFLYKKRLQIKTLKGLIPICSNCKKIRNDTGYYEQVEDYISNQSDVEFSHGLCPDCIDKLYPDYKRRNK